MIWLRRHRDNGQLGQFIIYSFLSLLNWPTCIESQKRAGGFWTIYLVFYYL